MKYFCIEKAAVRTSSQDETQGLISNAGVQVALALASAMMIVHHH